MGTGIMCEVCGIRRKGDGVGLRFQEGVIDDGGVGMGVVNLRGWGTG